MENFNKNIDQFFSDESKKAEENMNFPNFEKVWDEVEKRLDEVETKTKKRLIPIWLPYSIAASLVLTFGLIYFFNEKEVQNNDQNTALNKPVKNIDNQNNVNYTDNDRIVKTDQMVKQNIIKKSIKDIGSKKDLVINNSYHYQQIPVPEASSNPVQEINTESSKYFSEEINKEEISNNNKEMMLAKADSSPVLTQNKTKDDFDKINETNKYKKTEAARIAFDNQKMSEQLSTLAEQPAFADNTDTEDVNDFKISNRHDSEPLYIVDGYVADAKFLKNYNKKKITSLNIVEGDNAKKLYGNLAKKGVIVITTKGLNAQEMDYLKKNSKNYHFSEKTN